MQGVISLLIVAWIVAAWFTHLIICFTEAAWGFLIAGAIFFPIAVVHGTAGAAISDDLRRRCPMMAAPV